MLLWTLVLCWSLSSGNVAESTMKPLHYNLTILAHLFNPISDSRYEGVMAIKMLSKQRSNTIYLNAPRELSLNVKKTWIVRYASGGESM
ncbi:uncharacterized protein LOC122319884 [Drosophila ficusphila]|uniref:uncharacterized protein LOC122319884 n=1 Tax=Drosophila ficusphila TaxID=30025 RepID=UPI001C8AF7A2|nr:uncharacterized protein LOC122319884 [Drosophila ficusphila]